MGLKLGMSVTERKAAAGQGSDAPQMRHVRIDELWAEAQRERVLPAEYRAFIRARLVQPSIALAHRRPVAEELMGRLALLGEEIGGGLRTLGDGLGNALKDMAPK